jgi:hypothetical protein
MSQKREVESLFDTIEELGWKVIGVDDGEGYEKMSRKKDVVDAVMGVDEAGIKVEKHGQKGVLYVVLGNGPGELIADCSSKVEEILDAHMKKWD